MTVENLPWIVAACAVLAAILAVAKLIRGDENRSTKTDDAAVDALQTAAEAVEDLNKISERMRVLEKELIEVADRVRREIGDSLESMRTKIHEIETWTRDEFMRKKSLEAILARAEKEQAARDERLDRRLERIETKFDTLLTARGGAVS